MELQGIVVAIFIAAILLNDRLGGSEEVGRRMLQAGLALALVFLALSFTNAFIRVDREEAATLFGFDFGDGDTFTDDTKTADVIVASAVIHFALGVLLLVTGFWARIRSGFVALSLIVAGVLLILIGGLLSESDAYNEAVRLAIGSSQEVDIVMFVVAMAGAGALLWQSLKMQAEIEAELAAVDGRPEDADG